MQRLAIAGVLFALACAPAFAADAPPNLEGVWGMVQHDRLGAPFFIPIEPKYTDEGKRITTEFMSKYDVKGNVTGAMEANGHCVEPGMPTVMWGIELAAVKSEVAILLKRRATSCSSCSAPLPRKPPIR